MEAGDWAAAPVGRAQQLPEKWVGVGPGCGSFEGRHRHGVGVEAIPPVRAKHALAANFHHEQCICGPEMKKSKLTLCRVATNKSSFGKPDDCSTTNPHSYRFAKE